jgi:TolB-like protein/Tfp pilus assembly protein PilF
MNEVESQEENSLQMESRRMAKKSISIYHFLATSSILLLTIALIVWRPFQKTEEIADKSIAVLPCINDSPDQENEYFINGIMDDLTKNLQTIKELRVLGRFSTEQYRNNPKPIPEIASEMNVAHILFSSGQRYGDNIRLRVQLLEGATGENIWTYSYDVMISETEDIFRIQSELAKSLAEELQAVITPEEKQLIENIPTENQTAYDFFLQGEELFNSYFFYHPMYGRDRELLIRALYLFQYALEYDPEFTYPYVSIAHVYSLLYQRNSIDNADYLDSVIIYADKALSIDNQLYTAYALKGHYFYHKSELDTALELFDKAIELNPNFWIPYHGKAWTYYELGDYPRSIENLNKLSQQERGFTRPRLLRNLGILYMTAGFQEKQIELIEEAFSLDQDTLMYYSQLANSYFLSRKYQTAIEYGLKAFDLDSTSIIILNSLGDSYFRLRVFDSAYFYYSRFLKIMEESNLFIPYEMADIAYIFQQIGDQEKAQYYIGKMYEHYKDREEFDMAIIFIILGDIEKVYYHLSEQAKSEKYTIWYLHTRNNPLYDKISSEPEFLKIVDSIEENYYKQHERVRRWLEDNDLL